MNIALLSRKSIAEFSGLSVRNTFDGTLLLVSVVLLMIGWIMIASASIDVAELRNDNPFHYVVRHGVFILMGTIAGLITFQLPTEWWQKSGWLLLSISLLLLLVVLLPGVGKTVNGSTRWISLGSLNMQPSELAKLFLISYLAGYLVRRRDEVMSSWWGFLKPMLLLLLSVALGLGLV